MRFWLLPWTWEENSNATLILGIPVPSHFYTSQPMEQIQSKLVKSLAKLKLRHLSLAGRVMVANGLIMSSIWYFITLWASELSFFTKLQGLIESYVWAGRSRVSRGTVTQPKACGGFGVPLDSGEILFFRWKSHALGPWQGTAPA